MYTLCDDACAPRERDSMYPTRCHVARVLHEQRTNALVAQGLDEVRLVELLVVGEEPAYVDVSANHPRLGQCRLELLGRSHRPKRDKRRSVSTNGRTTAAAPAAARAISTGASPRPASHSQPCAAFKIPAGSRCRSGATVVQTATAQRRITAASMQGSLITDAPVDGWLLRSRDNDNVTCRNVKTANKTSDALLRAFAGIRFP
jgi:hypothetical protein